MHVPDSIHHHIEYGPTSTHVTWLQVFWKTFVRALHQSPKDVGKASVALEISINTF